MGTWARACRIVALLTVAVACRSALADPYETFYERAHVREAVSGTIRVDVHYEVALELPADECSEGRFGCRREQRFGQLYRIRFTRNELLHEEGAGPKSTVVEVGSISLAVDLSRPQELELENAIEQVAGQLHGDSFRQPFAGWDIGTSPLDPEAFFGPSHRTAWLCREDESTRTVYRVELHVEDGEAVGRSMYRASDPEQVDPICAALRAEGEPRHSFVTPFDIGSLVRQEIAVSTSWVPGELQPVPPEMEYTRTAADPELQTSSMGRDSAAGYYTVSATRAGRKTDLRLGEFKLAPPEPDSAAWVSRWRFSRKMRRFGMESQEEGLENEELWIVALPLDVEGVVGDEPKLDLAALLGPSLERAAALGPATFPDLFQRATLSHLGRQDWMLLFCSPRREPEYGVSGFLARLTLRNGDAVCDAVSRLYGNP